MKIPKGFKRTSHTFVLRDGAQETICVYRYGPIVVHHPFYWDRTAAKNRWIASHAETSRCLDPTASSSFQKTCSMAKAAANAVAWDRLRLRIDEQGNLTGWTRSTAKKVLKAIEAAS